MAKEGHPDYYIDQGDQTVYPIRESSIHPITPETPAEIILNMISINEGVIVDLEEKRRSILQKNVELRLELFKREYPADWRKDAKSSC